MQQLISLKTGSSVRIEVVAVMFLNLQVGMLTLTRHSSGDEWHNFLKNSLLMRYCFKDAYATQPSNLSKCWYERQNQRLLNFVSNLF